MLYSHSCLLSNISTLETEETLSSLRLCRIFSVIRSLGLLCRKGLPHFPEIINNDKHITAKNVLLQQRNLNENRKE
jgi:hypothetical protein